MTRTQRQCRRHVRRAFGWTVVAEMENVRREGEGQMKEDSRVLGLPGTSWQNLGRCEREARKSVFFLNFLKSWLFDSRCVSLASRCLLELICLLDPSVPVLLSHRREHTGCPKWERRMGRQSCSFWFCFAFINVYQGSWSLRPDRTSGWPWPHSGQAPREGSWCLSLGPAAPAAPGAGLRRRGVLATPAVLPSRGNWPRLQLRDEHSLLCNSNFLCVSVKW